LAESGARELRQRVLRKNELRDDLALTYETGALFTPVRRRGAFAQGNATLNVAAASGFVLYAPPQGLVVTHASCAQDLGGVTPWRWMVGNAATINLSSQAPGTPTPVPLFPGLAPLAAIENFHFVSIGDGFHMPARVPLDAPVVVAGGLFFIAALIGANFEAEWAVRWEEFIAGDEEA